MFGHNKKEIEEDQDKLNTNLSIIQGIMQNTQVVNLIKPMNNKKFKEKLNQLNQHDRFDHNDCNDIYNNKDKNNIVGLFSQKNEKYKPNKQVLFDSIKFKDEGTNTDAPSIQIKTPLTKNDLKTTNYDFHLLSK